ncbi:hypothetical protein AAHC03_0577 [Spirometra sp. Aus1]
MNVKALSTGLIVLVVVILLIGSGCAAIGFFFRYNIQGFRKLLEDQVVPLKALSGVSEEKIYFLLNEVASDITDGIQSVLLCLGFYGVATAIAALLGLIGVGARVNYLLTTFCLILTFLMLGKIIGISMFGNDRAHLSNIVLTYLTPRLSKYRGLNGTNKASFVWNLIMLQLKCCGLLNGYELPVVSVPVCCMRDSSLRLLYSSCSENQTYENSFIGFGCKPVILNIIYRSVDTLIGCIFLGILLESIALAISFVLIKYED